MSNYASGTRREMNKQATRQAIVDAALGLLRSAGREAVSAAAIAEAAGISRRTLFNYFPTVDAIMAEPLRRLLDRVVELLEESEGRLPLLTAAIRALHGAGVPELLAPVAQLSVFAQLHGAGSGCGQSNEWQDASADVTAAVERHCPSADPFEARIFAHSVLGAGQAAFDEWTRRLMPAEPSPDDGPPGAAVELSEADIALLHGLLTHALEQLAGGFPALLTAADDPQKDL